MAQDAQTINRSLCGECRHNAVVTSRREAKGVPSSNPQAIGTKNRWRRGDRRMAEIWQFLVSGVAVLLLLQYLKQLWSSRRLPPGPFPLPFIGGLWQMGLRFPPDILIQLAKQYGNIYTIWMGHRPVVVLSGFQTVKEGMVATSEAFSDRPKVAFAEAVLKKTSRGIIFGSGHPWKEHRRFSLVTMRKMGIGKKSMESQIKEEIQLLLDTFQHSNGEALDPFLLITAAVSNVIYAVTIGYRFSPQDKTFQKTLDAINYIGKYGMSIFAFLYEIFPWLMRHLPGPHKEALNLSNWMLSFVRTEVKRHKESPPQDEPQDIMDHYLSHIEKRKDDPLSTFNEDNLTTCILDFFIAGTETTTVTLLWALLFMVYYPDVQEKVYKEIEDALGSSAVICYEDHKNLPYTSAVIHEVMRLRYILIVGIPRQSTKDVSFHGFHIPKGTIVIADLQSVLLDPNQWETPDKFNPSHFLDKDGKFMAREEFLPFGAGSRVCLGEALAKMELFLFFTHLLRAFQFKLPEGTKDVSLEPRLGFVLRPNPYKIRAIPRNRL